MVRCGEGMPLMYFARRIDSYELLGHGQNRLAGLGLHSLPRMASKPIQGRLGSVTPDIFLDEVDPIYGKIETVRALILQVEEFSLGTGHLQEFKAPVDTDPILQM